MPRLWTRTIQEHRREVHDAILDTTAALVAERGLLSVTMSQIAEETGIGRATLYKYFPDVEAIFRAWHEREIARHLSRLADVRDQGDDPWERLASVLEMYAVLSQASQSHHDADIVAFVHRDPSVGRARQRVHGMIRDLLADATRAGYVRSDVSADELATYCLNALGAAHGGASKAAVRRIVAITLDALRPPG